MALTMPGLALTMPGLALTMPARSSPSGIFPNVGRLGAGKGVPGYACEWHLNISTRGAFETTFREAASATQELSEWRRSHRCWSPQRPICIVADVLDASRVGRAAWNDVHGEG